MKSILFILFLLMIVEGKAESPSSLLLEKAHSTPVYKLSKHKWLVFPLSSQSSHYRTIFWDKPCSLSSVSGCSK